MDKVSVLNYLVNQPEIQPFVAPGWGEVDLAPFFDNPKNVMLGDERGAVLFHYRGDGEYIGHYMMTDAYPRDQMMGFFRDCIRELFTTHGASVIRGYTPRDNVAACLVSRALGFSANGESTDSSGRACKNFILERRQWEAS